MRKTLTTIAIILLLVLALSCGLAACGTQEAKLTSIKVATGSLKNAYTVGDELNLDGARLVLSYSDGSTKEIELTENMLSGEFNTKSEGSRSIIVTYSDQSCKFSYTVVAPAAASHVLSVELTGIKTNYKVNESMSYEGTLSATFDDGTSGEWTLESIRRTLNVNGFKTDKAGNFVCQLSFDSVYGMITADYAYQVAQPAKITKATYTYNQPLVVFVDDTRAEFATALSAYPFEVTYSDDTVEQVYVRDANAIDRNFSTEAVSANNAVNVTVTDAQGRTVKVSVTYAVVERYAIHEVTFEPNFESAARVTVRSSEWTGKVAQQNYNRKGYACLGWYVGSESGERFNFNSVVEDDLLLVAKWQIQDYYVKITNFGQPYGSTRFYTVADTLTLDEPLAQDGYEFLYYTYNGTPIENNTIYAGTYAENLDLVAVWHAIEYDVSYVLNDSLTYPVTNKEAFAPAKYTTQDTRALTAPVREGYTFVGWSTEQNGTRMVSSFGGLTGDLTLYANWTANTYYVTFIQAETGREIGTKLGFSAGATDDIAIKPAEVVGYRFEGWYTDEGCENIFNNGVYVIRRGAFAADFTLYAKTTPVYTLYLAREDREGKTAVQFAVSEDEDEAYLSAWRDASTRRNCLLDHWYYAGDDTLDALSLRIETGDETAVSATTEALAAYDGKTLTAVWKGYERTITYYYNDDRNTQVTATYDTYLGTVLMEPERAGYYFAGWKRNSLLSGATYTEIGGCEENADLSFYAKWIVTSYTVRFYYLLDDASLLTKKLENVKSTAAYTVDTYDYTVESPTLAFTTVSAKYNTFGGWYTSMEFSPRTRVGELTQGTVGITELYAKWTPTVYGIRFYDKGTSAFGGTLDGNQIHEVTYRTDDVVLYTPAKRGYAFEGWYRDRAATEKMAQNDAGQYVVNIGDVLDEIGDTLRPDDGNMQYVVTAYAKWTAIPYTITFGNGKAGNTTVSVWDNPNTEGSDTTLTFTADYPVTLADATANGYAFLGWYTDNTYARQVRSTAELFENTALYPKWEKATFQIAYGNLTEEQVTAMNLPTTYQLSGNLSAASSFNTNLKNKLVRFGYTIVAVYETEDLSGTAVTMLGSASPNGTNAPYCKDVVLYCDWATVTYVVALKYTTPTGTTADYVAAEWGAKSRSMTVEDIGDGYQLPQMSQTGYVTQRDWYADKTFTKPIADGVLTIDLLESYKSLLTGTTTKTLTVYSRFEAQTYTLSFRCGVEGAALPADTTFTYFEGKALQELDSTETHKWFGWYTDETYAQRVQNVNINKSTNNLVAAEDLVLWGRMEAYRTITYDLAGADELTNPTVRFTTADVVTLPTAVYSDKVFAGWYIEDVGNVGVTLTGIDRDVTVTPLFANKGTTAKTYLGYNADGTAGVVCRYEGANTCVLPTTMGTAAMYAAGTEIPVTAIANGVFDGKATSSINIPTGYTSIGRRAFAGCKISTVTLPATVTTIGSDAFAGCTSLKTATILGGAIGANSYLFSGCTTLTTVTIRDCTIADNSNMLYGCAKVTTVTLDCDTVGVKALVGASALSKLYVKGNVAIATMFNTTSGQVNYPDTLNELHITGDGITQSFGNLIEKFTTIGNVYLDANAVVDVSYIATFLSTRTIYVPSALVETYKATYPDWNILSK